MQRKWKTATKNSRRSTVVRVGLVGDVMTVLDGGSVSASALAGQDTSNVLKRIQSLARRLPLTIYNLFSSRSLGVAVVVSRGDAGVIHRSAVVLDRVVTLPTLISINYQFTLTNIVLLRYDLLLLQ